MTKLSRRKRKLLKTEGFPFPCLPSVNEVNKLLSTMIIESLDIDPLINPKEYDQKAFEILEQGKIYIGMPKFSLILRLLYVRNLYFFHLVYLLGKADIQHLTTEARRRGDQRTRTVLTVRDVPVRVLDLRFIVVKLVKSVVDRYEVDNRKTKHLLYILLSFIIYVY